MKQTACLAVAAFTASAFLSGCATTMGAAPDHGQSVTRALQAQRVAPAPGTARSDGRAWAQELKPATSAHLHALAEGGLPTPSGPGSAGPASGAGAPAKAGP